MSKGEKAKCPKCGFKNLPGAKYCSNCGKKFEQAEATGGGGLEALYLLHLTGSLYLLLSLVFNSIVQVTTLLSLPYLASGVLGLVSAYMFIRRSERWGRWAKLVSAAAIATGFGGSLTLFLIGLDLKGIVGPAWVIFLISAWRLWKDRSKI